MADEIIDDDLDKTLLHQICIDDDRNAFLDLTGGISAALQMKDIYGDLPMHNIAYNGYSDLLIMLFENGYGDEIYDTLYIKNDYGRTVLDVIEFLKQKDVLRVLLTHSDKLIYDLLERGFSD